MVHQASALATETVTLGIVTCNPTRIGGIKVEMEGDTSDQTSCSPQSPQTILGARQPTPSRRPLSKERRSSASSVTKDLKHLACLNCRSRKVKVIPPMGLLCHTDSMKL